MLSNRHGFNDQCVVENVHSSGDIIQNPSFSWVDQSMSGSNEAFGTINVKSGMSKCIVYDIGYMMNHSI